MSFFAKLKKRIWANSFFTEFYVYLNERKRFFAEAKERFGKERYTHGSLKDYKAAFRKHRVTYNEYMYNYEFWHLDEEARDEFISTSEMQVIYRKLGASRVRDVFHNKEKFLDAFSPYIHRWWALANSLTFEDFQEKVQEFDVIAKPMDGTRGEGIFKIVCKEVTDWHHLYESLIKDNYLLEQCIVECDELSSFHPASLNTIRVVTISNGDRCEVFGALFRMGAHGSVIDNTHSGGIYAPINVETGTIDISAIDAHNHHFLCHPDSNKPIKGFKLPQWDSIVATCKDASKVIPNTHFAGWDLCVLKDGQIEIIEGNHAPDFDGGMQAPLKIGVKKRLKRTVIDVLGVDPIKLISIWY